MSSLDNELKEEMVKVGKKMVDMLKSDNIKMREVMNWVLKSKGKMLRPKFLILSSKFGKEKSDVTEHAALLEIVHMASLVHDDIIDNADTRRGEISVQKKFGVEMAVYAGDFMIFSALTSNGIMSDEKYKEYIGLFKKICYGELGQYSMLYNLDITEEEYLENITGKTATMFEIACTIGAFAAKAENDIERFLADFGRNYGIIFQIRDDLLDYKSKFSLIGKPSYQDFANGIYTLPIIYAAQNKEQKKKFSKLAVQVKKFGISEEICKEIENLIVLENGFEKCKNKVNMYYQSAKEAICKLPDIEAKGYFEDMLNSLYSSVMNEF